MAEVRLAESAVFVVIVVASPITDFTRHKSGVLKRGWSLGRCFLRSRKLWMITLAGRKALPLQAMFHSADDVIWLFDQDVRLSQKSMSSRPSSAIERQYWRASVLECVKYSH